MESDQRTYNYTTAAQAIAVVERRLQWNQEDADAHELASIPN